MKHTLSTLPDTRTMSLIVTYCRTMMKFRFLMFTGAILMLMIPLGVNAGADISKFVGTWRGQTRDIAGRPAINEIVLMRNGQFSSLTKSSSGFVILIQGKYQVNSDFIRFTIEKWEPRSYLGKSINMPRGETTYYRFINTNQMRVGSTKCSFGGCIILMTRVR
jgi:hypothetical protein